MTDKQLHYITTVIDTAADMVDRFRRQLDRDTPAWTGMLRAGDDLRRARGELDTIRRRRTTPNGRQSTTERI